MAQMDPLTPERRRAMTRRYLLDAATLVFAEKGFQGATLDEVAMTAGFSKGAVYSNFASKEDLFLGLLEDRMEQLFEATLRVIADKDASLGVDDLASRESPYQDDEWETLYLEFTLYARRKPEVAASLAALAQRERDLIRSLLEREYAESGAEPLYPVDQIAAVAQALFTGLSTARLVDAAAVNVETIDIALALIHSSMGTRDDGSESERAQSLPRPAEGAES